MGGTPASGYDILIPGQSSKPSRCRKPLLPPRLLTVMTVYRVKPEAGKEPPILNATLIFDKQRADANEAIMTILTDGLMPAFGQVTKIRASNGRQLPVMDRRELLDRCGWVRLAENGSRISRTPSPTAVSSAPKVDMKACLRKLCRTRSSCVVMYLASTGSLRVHFCEPRFELTVDEIRRLHSLTQRPRH